MSPNRAFIHQGSVAVYVPPSAQGFILDGPGGSVKDSSASFGVSARGGEMDVHVLNGMVDAQPIGSPAVNIPVGTALRIRDGATNMIVARPQDFLTTLPPEHPDGAYAYLHWSFDEMEGDTVHADGRGFDTAAATGRFVAPQENPSLKPSWEKGASGSALGFSGRGEHVRTGFSGLGGSEPRTVCCWVKIPRNLQWWSEGYAMIGWGAHTTRGDTWQMSINPVAEDGPVGRLRLGTFEGQAIGTTDLRDDTWHHVAAVLFEGRPANVATHVLLYVDGKLESAASKSILTVDTDIKSSVARPVMLGVDTGTLGEKTVRSLRGVMDEVAIYAGALSQEEIIAVMTKGAAPGK